MLGTGILTTTGIILSHVKAPEAVIAVWLVGGILAWFGAYCYGEIARMLPQNGGEATILRSFFSPTLGEIAGWTSFVVAFSASNAATSLALSAYLGQALPGISFRHELVAAVALVLVTSLHSVMGRSGLRIQTLLAIAKFSLLAGLALYALFLNSPASLVATPQVREAAEFGTHWGVALMLAMFAYSGWNAAIYVAGEAHDPHHTVRNAMIIGTTITLILYVSVNVALLRNLPLAEIEGVIPVISVLVKHLFGSGASAIFSGLVAFALLSSLGASAFLGPRVLATMLSWLRKDRTGPVVVSPGLIWIQALLSVLMVMTGTFEQILTVMGFLLGLFPIICVLGIYRQVRDVSHRPQALAKYVFAPLFIGSLSVILVLGAMQQPKEVAVALGLIASFFVLRLSVRKFI